jgi:hypothetical protein
MKLGRRLDRWRWLPKANGPASPGDASIDRSISEAKPMDRSIRIHCQIEWHGTKSGVFSVRSAYHIEWKHQFNGVTCRSLISGTSLNNPTWKILWKLDAPAKVKIFCWRLMHGIIPIKAILMKRHIGTTDLCPLCNIESEDTMHMVFTCQ